MICILGDTVRAHHTVRTACNLKLVYFWNFLLSQTTISKQNIESKVTDKEGLPYKEELA
jgi:hypothetical protein